MSVNHLPNHLANESSPYLKQHMYNPVDWYPWSQDALEKAKKENRLLIISIGYSACHWCHVMERESFENEEVAEMMNANFISVKIDREERPDLDHFYMDAMQVLNGNGGWPLNVFALADGRPFYGGTYFTRDQWLKLCSDIARLHQQRPHEIEQYAENLCNGIASVSDIVEVNNETDLIDYNLRDVFKNLYTEFDQQNGGLNSRHKFPMPVVLDFLLKYYFYTRNTSALDVALLTLDRMSQGGIYDHLAGGFARYATDKLWKIPHFEKMLYDNAQLVNLYTDAFRITADQKYKEVVYQTIDFVKKELTSPEGGFYSSLDADSEGVEGKYYVWTEHEFDLIITEHRDFLKEYFGLNNRGAWEDGKFVLYLPDHEEELFARFGLSNASARYIIANAKKLLRAERDKRIRPGLDDKQLLSWNALMLKALSNAYSLFREPEFLELALNNYRFIHKNFYSEGNLSHKSSSQGKALSFMDDYALYISALISLYRCCFDPDLLLEAKTLTEQCLVEFYDPKKGFFSFTRLNSNETVVRKFETIDNVIPSSNAVMAENLMQLYAYFSDNRYYQKALPMIKSMYQQVQKYPASYSLWTSLLLMIENPFYEVAVVGYESEGYARQLIDEYLPNIALAASNANVDEISLLNERYKPGQTLVYVCKNHVCNHPETDLKKVLDLIKK